MYVSIPCNLLLLTLIAQPCKSWFFFVQIRWLQVFLKALCALNTNLGFKKNQYGGKMNQIYLTIILDLPYEFFKSQIRVQRANCVWKHLESSYLQNMYRAVLLINIYLSCISIVNFLNIFQKRMDFKFIYYSDGWWVMKS